MQLHWATPVRLSAPGYEAWISPSAGGRLGRLLWHGPNGDRELVVPVDTQSPFDEDEWPKQGAFPMLPYANRLKDGRFRWDGVDRRVRAVPGRSFGLHGFGHRRAWRAIETEGDRVLLEWRHEADAVEWPWSFTARLAYSLSADGLAVDLAIRNDAIASMPAILGWHPYVPAGWLAASQAGGMACAAHALDEDGACAAGQAAPALRKFMAGDRAPHTVAFEGWGSSWSIQSPTGECWRLTADAAHLVHHVPDELTYACIEPVTALPGRLRAAAGEGAQGAIDLQPGAWRRLKCGLQGTA